MRTNLYRSNCHNCQRSVEPQTGLWDGDTFCNETCLESYVERRRAEAVAEIAERRNFQQNLIREMTNGIAEKTLSNLLTKATGSRVATLADLDDATGEDLLAILGRLHDRNRRAEQKARRTERPKTDECPRCAGAGESSKWIATGSVCYRCDGTGKDPKGIR
jgi:hypothetical protein